MSIDEAPCLAGPFNVKRLSQTESPIEREIKAFAEEFAGSRFAVLVGKRVRLTCAAIASCRAREMFMWLSSTPSFDTSLRQGGVGGAKLSDRRHCRSLAFAPMPSGTDIARPADPS
jgi:hypothetical protein